MQALATSEIAARMAALPAWHQPNGQARIEREFVFKNFVQAFGFMSQMALISEKQDHHPEWFNVYNRVRVQLTTHDAGGLSERDFVWAQAADQVAAGLKG
jgi:4a-hydroxytetrahydrobiopterin dehydratase